ncbi:MAG TPA: NlpC/P60 family protein [Jatrophihabitans sp.]|nr:NlpC/P60 family protein [Jatrophihabitans sp.]
MHRLAALGATVATAAGLLLAAPPAAHGLPSTPPPNPSDGQISAAQQHKDSLAAQVGALGGKIAQAQAELRALQGKRELAEQKVALAVSELRDARTAAVRARARVQQAERSVQQAHVRFVQYLQASYMDGGTDGTTGSLLTASNPTALLDESSLQRYQAENKLDAIGNLQRATVVKSNADAAARQAVQNIAAKAAAARRAKQAADDAVASQQAEEASLRATLASSQDALSRAQSTLAQLNHERAAYIAYKKEQARLARIAARRKARRIAARQAARREARQEARQQARERARHAHQGNGGGSQGHSHSRHHSGGGGGWPIAHGTGHWTAAEAATAVRRVRSTLGTPYAWAGGNSWGPTYGVCDPSNGAPNDCHVYGYDCSGLMMYGWGPYLSMPHYAASQYVMAGSYHPSMYNLRPGDLVFWSFNGAISGIHHVAMYVGGGRIIEAPYSGSYVRYASLWEYGAPFGATRPLT